MIIEINLANLIFIVIASLSGVWALIKIIAMQSQRITNTRFELHEQKESANHEALGKRLDSIETTARQESGQWQRVERELLTMKADLPLHYVRREDYIRGQSVIEAKLDALGTKFENAQLRDRRKPHAATD